MSIDVSHIIRHNFRKVDDRVAINDFVLHTMGQLKEKLYLHEADDDFEYYNLEEYNEYYFRVPYYKVDFYLHAGCWRVESYFDYYQLFMHDGGIFPIRRTIYDLARALGQSEVWHASEHYTWNGNGLEETDQSFERWLNIAKQRLSLEDESWHRIKEIPEFPKKDILSVPDNGKFYNYVNVYHDNFKDCDELFKIYQDQLNDMRLLGLTTDAKGYLRCEKGGVILLVNERDLSNKS